MKIWSRKNVCQFVETFSRNERENSNIDTMDDDTSMLSGYQACQKCNVLTIKKVLLYKGNNLNLIFTIFSAVYTECCGDFNSKQFAFQKIPGVPKTINLL